MNKLKLHIILLVLFWTSSGGYSQEHLPASFKNFQETVWLESERHIYFPGEIIRFNATVLEKDTYKKSGLSNVIRVELLDANGEAVDQQNLILDMARIKGLIQLPGDSKTGFYYLRAYTNWMRNFPSSNYGLLTIKVVNPNDPMPILSEEKEEEEEAPSSIPDHVLEVRKGQGELSIYIGDMAFEKSDSVRLVIHQSYTVIVDSSLAKQPDIELNIPEKEFPEGIFQVSLLNKNQIISKRLGSFYQAESGVIDFNLPDTIMNVRNSYSVDFGIPSMVEGLTVSISLVEPDYPGENYIPGLPGWNCNAKIPNDNEGFKEWLLNNSYQDSVIFEILDKREDRLVNNGLFHFPETQSGIISGKVIKNDTNDAQADKGVCLTVLNDNYFDAVSTDQSGQFFFVLPGHSGSNDLIINLTNFEDTSSQIEITPLFDPKTVLENKELTLTKAEFEFLQKQNINQQLRNFYNTLPTISAIQHSPKRVRETFFHPPDYTRVVGKYIKLANIGEIIYEVVPTVSVRKKNDREYISVYNEHPNSANFETLVLLDGIPLADQRTLLDLPPERIEVIEVKSKLYMHGRSIFSSIVNFISPNKDYAGLELPETSILTTVELPVRANTESFFDEELSQSLPILENTLLWSKEISSNSKSIEFQTNDLKGDFRIYVNGVDRSGKWVFGTRHFRVE